MGQSRAKWSYLPEAQNDFIFAIIGEELGFIRLRGGWCCSACWPTRGLREEADGAPDPP